jgi:PAS domain-containing protein
MTKFKFIRDLSIKNKIIIIILSLVFLIHSIGFTFITIWDVKRIKTEIQTGLVLNTKLIANNCVVPLTFGDDQQATEALSHLKNIDFIETGCLFDIEGNIFATYPDTLNKKAFPIFPEQQNNILKDGFFYVHEPVMFQNKKYGILFIKANSKPLKAAKRSIIITLILLSIVLDILSIFLAIKMQRYISKPIINLKNHFNKIAENQDFTACVLKQNNDEIGSLYDGFNNLINQIQNRSIERDNAEKLLRKSQEKLDLALQGGDIGIWEWDLKTNLTVWDTKMESLFGLEEGSFKQSFEAFKECLHPDDIILVEKAIQDALDSIAPYDTIYRVVWENKEIKFIRAKALISKNEEQEPITMIGVCFDVTEIKEAEDELKKHRETLEDLVKERTKKLEENNNELERFNDLFIDREFRIKELRNKLNSLDSDNET